MINVSQYFVICFVEFSIFRDNLEPMAMSDDGLISESCLLDHARDNLDRSCSNHNGFGYGPLICCGGWCRASFLGEFGSVWDKF